MSQEVDTGDDKRASIRYRAITKLIQDLSGRYRPPRVGVPEMAAQKLR